MSLSPAAARIRSKSRKPTSPAVVPGEPEVLEALIVGAGFSGLCMAIKLRQAGLGRFVVLEKAHEVGGTWRDNTYPGCACDVQSHLYSYSFEPKLDWSRMFAPQEEILAYLRHCAYKYGVRPAIRFGQKVVRARFDEGAEHWLIETEGGQTFRARHLISGMGALHIPTYPQGVDPARFRGISFHSAEWNHQASLEGKRVAVVGTGASAIQFVPKIAPTAAALALFQRTPPWVLPKLDRPFTPAELGLLRRVPGLARLLRGAIYVNLESRALGFTVSPRLMKGVELLGRRHIRRQIRDPHLRRQVTPDYTAGCKRLLISNDYYQALDRPNVEVVTGGVDAITERGVRDGHGRVHEVDVIIYGTGFRVQDPFARGTIIGRRGIDLVDAWPEGPEAYLGINVAQFPNLHLLMGPNTGLGHNSMIYMIESQVHYVITALRTMKKQGLRTIEVRGDRQRSFNQRLQKRLARTVWSSGCQSWYLNEHGRNTTLWPGFTFDYRRRARDIDLASYRTSRGDA